MVLTGRQVSAQRLYDLGAINRVVAAGQSLGTALAMAAELAQKPPLALAGLKQVLAMNDNAPLGEALRHEQEVFQSVVITDAAIAGMQRVQSGYDLLGKDDPA
jgi:enoyl-CoA hydratase/carnithine racemase